MLQQILDYIHNYFEKYIYKDHFVVRDGILYSKCVGGIGRYHIYTSLDEVCTTVLDQIIYYDASNFLQDGQYFRIVGSVFNDGVYKFPAEGLIDEKEFVGEVWAMAVPPAVIKLVTEIEGWQTATSTNNTPYVTESFGGYSYTRGTSKITGAPIGWQDIFHNQLNQWRKIS